MSPNQPLTILHVEDDDVDVMDLQRSFRKANIANRIVTAGDGEKALDIMRGDNGCEPLPRPFIMLVDINMPRMNGIELLNEVRADRALRDTVAFVLTTSDHDTDILSAYDLNVAGYLLKQDAGPQFQQAVTLLESYWHSVELPQQPGAAWP